MKRNLLNHKKILLPIAFTLLLLLVRMMYTGQLVYIFLASNLFLAWIPYGISNALGKAEKIKQWKYYFFLGLWLLFFPNAPYIITDLLHLKERPPIPYWYDTVLLFSASLNGLVLGFLSVQNIDNSLTKRFNRKKARSILVVSFFLCAFGIYLGRFLRWNSWDIFFNTPQLVDDIADRFLNPFDHFRTWGITAVFGFFLCISYFS